MKKLILKKMSADDIKYLTNYPTYKYLVRQFVTNKCHNNEAEHCIQSISSSLQKAHLRPGFIDNVVNV